MKTTQYYDHIDVILNSLKITTTNRSNEITILEEVKGRRPRSSIYNLYRQFLQDSLRRRNPLFIEGWKVYVVNNLTLGENKNIYLYVTLMVKL